MQTEITGRRAHTLAPYLRQSDQERLDAQGCAFAMENDQSQIGCHAPVLSDLATG